MTREEADIADIAEALLASALTAFPNNEIPTSFVSVGSPTWDCGNGGQLTVHVPEIRPAPQNKCALAFEIDFTITYVTCVKTLEHNGKIPSPEVQQADAVHLLKRGWRLLYTLAQRRYSGELFGTTSVACENVSLGELVQADPSGGMAGWTMTITLTT